MEIDGMKCLNNLSKKSASNGRSCVNHWIDCWLECSVSWSLTTHTNAFSGLHYFDNILFILCGLLSIVQRQCPHRFRIFSALSTKVFIFLYSHSSTREVWKLNCLDNRREKKLFPLPKKTGVHDLWMTLHQIF